jgi:ribonuclease P protein component
MVYVGTADNDSPAKAGFIVSRAVGNAVVRNAVRRRLRHLMRERIAAQRERTLVVVRALAEAGSRSYAQMANDLDAALASADPRTEATS